MLLDQLVEMGLSHLLDLALEDWPEGRDPFAPVGRITAGIGWTDITTNWADSYNGHYKPFHLGWWIGAGGLTQDVNPLGPFYVGEPGPDAAMRISASYHFVADVQPALPLFPDIYAISEVWAWQSTTPGADATAWPAPSPLPADDEVDRKAAIQSALRALPAPRDSTSPEGKPWPTSPEKGDVVPGGEPVKNPDPWAVPKAVVEVIRDLTRDPGVYGPPGVINGDPTVYVPPGRAPGPVVRVLPKPMRERTKVVRQRNLPKGQKLRARAHQAAWALRVMGEAVMERCDDVKALWASLDDKTRKIIRQRWFEKRWANGDRRPPKVPPCNEMAELLWEYRRFLNVEPAFRELLWARVEDALYGRYSKLASDSLGKISRRTGPQTLTADQPGDELNNQHWSSNELPTEMLQEIITGREGRTSTANDRQFAIDEQIRRSANRRAEIARRRAYAGSRR